MIPLVRNKFAACASVEKNLELKAESKRARRVNGFEIGLKRGTETGKFSQIARTQATLNRIPLKKRLRSTQFNKSPIHALSSDEVVRGSGSNS